MAEVNTNIYPIGIRETGEIFSSQKEARLALGISAPYISQILNGDRKLKDFEIYRVKDRLFCLRCKEYKSIKGFCKRTWKNELGERRGYRRVCRECDNKKRRKEDAKDPEKAKLRRKKASLKTLYGMTYKMYEDMMESQESKCRICEELFVKTPHVDHCHETGKVRGLLCHNCNIALGGFKNKKNLKNAIKYLEDNDA